MRPRPPRAGGPAPRASDRRRGRARARPDSRRADAREARAAPWRARSACASPSRPRARSRREDASLPAWSSRPSMPDGHRSRKTGLSYTPAVMAGYVLIVESDAELQRQIGAALRDAGFDLHAEAEAAWAKRTFATRVPDVVVIDTWLTDADGFTFADELRQTPETRATPIVFVASTHRGVSHRAEARRRFAPADYLPTPLDLAGLAPRVAELAARGAAMAPEAIDVADQITPPPVPKETLR